MSTPLWRNRKFATYWTGQTVSQVGDRVSELALPLTAITVLHASAASVGLLTAAVWAPNILSLFLGSWVDQRIRKRRLLIIANAIQALALASVPVGFVFARLTLGQLFAVALITGSGAALYQVAYPTFFSRLVPKSRYVQANSLLSGTRSASFIVGAPIGGALVQTLTAPVALLVDAVSFVVSACTIALVSVDESSSDQPATPERFRTRVGSGIRFLMKHPYLRPELACATTVNFFSFMTTAVFVLFASRNLELSAGEIGIALGLGATGGLLGAVLASRFARRYGLGVAVVVGVIAFSAPSVFIPLASGNDPSKVAVLATVEFVSAAGIMLFDINLNSIQTAVTPDRMRSRAAGAFATVNYGIRPVGAVVGGLAAQWIGAGPTIIVAGIGGTLAFLWLLRSPIMTVRSVDELDSTEPS